MSGGPGGNRTPASAMRMPHNTTLQQALKSSIILHIIKLLVKKYATKNCVGRCCR